MPKMKLKTHRGAAKRFKKTGTGKFVRSKAFKQHILTSKTRSRKRALRGTTVVSAADQATLKRMLPD
jgi:large subunit ribosomal protein L35